jgi:hypothetical protein
MAIKVSFVRRKPFAPLRLGVFAFSLLVGVVSAQADEPLSKRIDQLILASAKQPASPVADDAEFLHRVTLDLAGRIPTASEVRTFFADTATDKRVKFVDQLLASPEYPRRMHDVFHVMLMERLGEHADWSKFLLTSFEKNKPWDQMVREMLSPNPDDEATRGAAFYWTKRLENYGQNPVDLPALTRDVGRMFLGKDFQCCQCHDHLLVNEYKQVHFQGLFAFVGNTFIRQDLKFPAVGEKPVAKKVEFMSVFVKEKKETGPRLPGGEEVAIPEFPKGEEFAVAPNKKERFEGTPKFSPLKTLSEQLPKADNAAFSKNIVNRLWFVMLGRGIVHPLDLHHVDNPPSHPELLDLLAKEFVAHQFDIKWLLREIALSEAYQRSSRLASPSALGPEPSTFLTAIEKPLSAEQVLASVLQATGESDKFANAATDPAAAKELDTLRERFRKAFANPPREPEGEYSPSVKGTLFLLNDATVLGWLTPRPGNLIDRLSKISEAPAVADELYLTVLSRLPSNDERTEVVAFLAKTPDQRPKILGQLAWALLASTEFSVNH